MNRTKGLNPISAKRRAKLAAAGVVFPTTTFTSPAKPAMKAGKRPAATGPDQATLDLVLARDNWSCVVCGEGLHGRRGHEWSIHHRIRRSQGVDNRTSNLITVCGDGCTLCHGDIHGAPAKAREAGWLLHSTDVPEEFRMAHSQHGWVLLDNQGGLVRVEPPSDPLVAPVGAGEES